MRTAVEDRIAEFIGKRVWAVVGASHDPAKFGYKIVRDLHNAGYVVYPVNPRGGEIEGMKVYLSLAALPEKPEVVDIVVPPAVTEKVVRQVKALGLTRVWMQPGSESEDAIRFCEENGIAVVHDACAMINKRIWDE
ncbi:MAG TPA: CoA-binding protein [Anaerolineae bacterium]|nr:CoA-binding protein [Anaerolineae bacterium]